MLTDPVYEDPGVQLLLLDRHLVPRAIERELKGVAQVTRLWNIEGE